VEHTDDVMNNAMKPKLPRWRYWAWRLSVGGEGKGYHKDPDLLAACPRCGGPNVVAGSRWSIPDALKSRPATWYYTCFDCDGFRDARLRGPGQDTQPGDVT
jgi:hypothetical protein